MKRESATTGWPSSSRQDRRQRRRGTRRGRGPSRLATRPRTSPSPSGRSQRMSFRSLAADRPASEEVAATQYGVLLAQPDHPLRPVEHRLLLGREIPGLPGDLVVLAVGVVVAAAGSAPTSSPCRIIGTPGRDQQRRHEVAHLARPQRLDRPGRRSRPRRRSSRTGCGSRRRGSPRRSPRCASRCSETRSRSVKPSCAVTKLMLAYGRRPFRAYRSLLPVSR